MYDVWYEIYYNYCSFMINNNCYIIQVERNYNTLVNRQNFMKYILYVSNVSMFDLGWYQSSIFYILWNFKYNNDFM